VGEDEHGKRMPHDTGPLTPPTQVLPIPGSSSPERILSHIAAQDVQLTDTEVKEIDDVLASFIVSGDRYPQQFMKDLVSIRPHTK
jgi:hypothetical protein